MERGYLKSKDKKLSYRVFGEGKNVVLAFHGYGQSAKDFQGAEKHFPDTRIYAFDLFFHGESSWQPLPENFSPEEWSFILSDFLKEQNIQKFSLLAFSLGARPALASFNFFPKEVNQIILLAPDGIHINFWYRVSTGFAPVRYLFRNSVDNPKTFLRLTRLFEKSRLVNKSLIRLAKKQMASKELRQRVYSSWMVYRQFKISHKELAQLIQKHGSKFIIIGATHDKLIPSRRLAAFSQLLPKENTVCRIENCGHYELFRRLIKNGVNQ